MERKFSHKVGVKVLSQAQLENIMPNYENLFQKIDTCRKVAQEELHADEKRHYQYNFMYDNVFSILGKRGTGKTSVAFTLQKMIRERYGKSCCDVVLPLIIPEVIPENCTVLGWILAIVREEIGALEDRINELDKNYREEIPWNKCRYADGKRVQETLSARLDTLSQLFFAGNYNPSNEVSYHRAVDNSVLQAGDYYKFAKGIAELWDAWVARIQYLHRLEKPDAREEICPLIYFIFDDVDLAPEKIEELLSVIIKYLSHPNIIVLTTADESLFLEVIENRLDKNIGRLPGEWRNYLANNRGSKYIVWSSLRDEEREEKDEENAEDLVKQTARMYLGKVLPTSTRYYLRLFNTAGQKETFRVETRINQEEHDENLGMSMADQVRLLIQDIRKENLHNFMESDMGIINFYLNFMGNTSRQISNVYIALKELIENLRKIVVYAAENVVDEDYLMTKIYLNCRYFLCVAINANHDLAKVIENVDSFVDEAFLPEYNQWKMYFNYSYLNEFLHKKLEKCGKQKKIKICLQLYSLLVFAENLLLIMEGGMPHGITGRKKTHAVSFLAQYISYVAFEGRHVFRDDLAPDEFFKHYVYLLDRLDVIVTDEISQAKFNLEYFYNFKSYSYKKKPGLQDLIDINKNNHKWFNELAGMLTMVYGNAYLVNSSMIEGCLIYSDSSYLTGYQKRIHNEIKNNIRNCLGAIKMQEVWTSLKEDFYKIIPFQYEGKNLFYDFVEVVKQELSKGDGQKGDSKGGRNLVGLRQVIETVAFALGNRMTGTEGITDFFKVCPIDILHDIADRKDTLDSKEEKWDLALMYMDRIAKADYAIVRRGILYDPINAIDVLKKLLGKNTAYDQQINEIIRRLSVLDTSKMLMAAEISKRLYADLPRLLKNVMECEGSVDSFAYDGEEIPLKNEVEEVLANLDIGININSDDELRAAVELGLQTLFVELMQRVYIYQSVSEKYINRHNMSSIELERYVSRGTTTDTYYYCLFNLMVELAENENNVEKQANWTEGNFKNQKADKERLLRETKSLAEDIRAAFTRERQRYVDLLVSGAENE